MTFDATNLNRLSQGMQVSIPKDSEGYVGRECPRSECEGYFKIKPGTGLHGENLPCHCPYCGHRDSPNTFFTKEQIEYATSVFMSEFAEAVHNDLKKLEFELKPRGALGIGISMKVQPGARPQIRQYREKDLETEITCDKCTLQYAVYGVFAYCPDCASHNSLLILRRNLDLARKQLDLADKLDDVDLKRHMVEDALENCVSAFDGFAREACRIRANRSSDPDSCAALSFQNLHHAAVRLHTLFGIDLAAAVTLEAWSAAHIAFMRRHLLAHKAGVMDQRYLENTGELDTLLGRRLSIKPMEVRKLADDVMRIGESLVSLLPAAE